jgi:hypothetical protein
MLRKGQKNSAKGKTATAAKVAFRRKKREKPEKGKTPTLDALSALFLNSR